MSPAPAVMTQPLDRLLPADSASPRGSSHAQGQPAGGAGISAAAGGGAKCNDFTRTLFDLTIFNVLAVWWHLFKTVSYPILGPGRDAVKRGTGTTGLDRGEVK